MPLTQTYPAAMNNDAHDAAGLELVLDDHLGGTGCACAPECRYVVGNFRKGVAYFSRIRRGYIACTPSEYLELAPKILERKEYSIATLDLDAYSDDAAVMEAARTTTEKRGRVNRDVARAERAGYYVKQFAFALHVPDIVDIHQSKPTRQGMPLSSYYLKTVEELGGAPTQKVEIETPACSYHHWQYWGVFQPAEGHRQGDVVTNEKLVGYVRLRRQGDSSAYTWTLGHGDHLREGVMYLLHYGIVRTMLQMQPPARPRYIVYHNYTAEVGNTLGEWKRRALFKPRYLYYVDNRAIVAPSEPEMPKSGRCIAILGSTVDVPWPEAKRTAELLGVAPRWTKFLHHIWVVEQARAPGLVMRVIANGPNPTADNLRDLASHMFPVECLEGRRKIAALLCGDTRGLDSLFQLYEAGDRNIAVYHPDLASLETLRATYPGSWSFAHLPDLAGALQDTLAGADAIIVESPGGGSIDYVRTKLKELIGGFSGRLIISFGEKFLAAMGYDFKLLIEIYHEEPEVEKQLTERLSQLLGRGVDYNGVYYRHGDAEDSFWFCLDLDKGKTL